MYLEYYSLDRPPFRITPDPSLFFTGGANGRGVVLEALLYAITSGEGILKVVGEVGSGKTMLCRMLEERLPPSVEMVYLANPNLSPHDILYAIAFELKLPVDHSTQRLVLMQHLQDYLLKQHAENRSVLVIIEEAQSMPIETLEEVRLFSNLETHQHKLMQIVLFGQPELDKNLQNKAIRQLRERITHSFYLRPLTVEETSDYIRFRLQAAGCPAPQIFSEAAEKLIAKASGGLTRRINIIADKALLAAYAESATGARPRTVDNMLQPTVLPRHVRAAISDSGYAPGFWSTPRVAAVIAGVGLVLVAGLWWQLGRPDATVPAVPATAATIMQAPTPAQTPVPAPAAVEAIAQPSPVVAPVAAATSQSTVPAAVAAEAPAGPDVAAAVPATDAAVLVPVDGADLGEPVVASATPAGTPGAAPQAATAVVAVEAAVKEEIALVETALLDAEEALAVAVAETPMRAAVNDIGELSPLLQERSLALQEWVAGVSADQYTVQLLSVNSAESAFVGRILTTLEQSGLIDQTYTCVSNSRGQDFWKVVYGNFASIGEARTLINSLPPSIRDNSPFVQSIRRLDCNVTMDLTR
jgi:type II secretory pathway predicted ATPase ExeA/septal ring-binding cell division protein DamX